MKLYMNGIFRNTESVVLIAELERAGYVKVEEPVEIPASEIAPEGGDLSSEVKQGEVPEKELTKKEKSALAKAEKEAAKAAQKEGE
jgi:hypothetical protein